MVGVVMAGMGIAQPHMDPRIAAAVQAPLGFMQRQLDARVWNAVIADATQPQARAIAEAMLAASQGASRFDAEAGAQQLPSVAVPGAAVIGTAAAITPVAPATSPQAAEVVRLTNEARAAKGLEPVTLDPRLVAAAVGHSRQMAAKQQMAHEGIGNGTPRERILAVSPTAARTAENVAVGQASAAEVMQGWMDSPGHRKNILDPKLRSIGVEVVTGSDGRPYWTQVFAGSARS